MKKNRKKIKTKKRAKKATVYKVNGENLPKSGFKAIKGDFLKFSKTASRMKACKPKYGDLAF